MLTFKSFTGINNVLPEHRMGSGDMLQASNVDIGSTGEIARRAGLQAVSDQCHRHLHEAHGFTLAVCAGQLLALHPDGSRHVIHPAVGEDRVWYCDLPDGRTTFSNGLIHGVTDGLTGVERSVPLPPALGAVDVTFGQLQPGAYRYHLTFMRLSDRLEGPAISSQPVQVSDGGLRLDGLPMLEGHALNVYLSSHSGEGAYLAGSTLGGSFEFSGSNTQLVLPCRTLGAQPFPVGTITAFWRGRVLVAQGNVLWASRPMAPHLSDWQDFKALQGTITAVQPVDNGIYVGTDQDLVFLAGTEWNQLAHVPTLRGPVVLGSGVQAPGHCLKLGDGTGSGQAMVCIAGGEVVAGFSGGQTQALTEDRYHCDFARVSAAFRDLDGIPQYMVVPL